MTRRTAFLAILVALAAGPALAQTPFPCRLGQAGKDSFLVAEAFALVILEEPPEAARSEYRVLVRNPHPWPAAVLAGIDLPGLVEAPAEPMVIPAREAAEVTIGWFPHDMSRGRMAPPRLEAVRARMTFPLCQVFQPAVGAVPSARRAVPARGFQVVRDEAADDLRQGF